MEFGTQLHFSGKKVALITEVPYSRYKSLQRCFDDQLKVLLVFITLFSLIFRHLSLLICGVQSNSELDGNKVERFIEGIQAFVIINISKIEKFGEIKRHIDNSRRHKQSRTLRLNQLCASYLLPKLKIVFQSPGQTNYYRFNSQMELSQLSNLFEELVGENQVEHDSLTEHVQQVFTVLIQNYTQKLKSDSDKVKIVLNDCSHESNTEKSLAKFLLDWDKFCEWRIFYLGCSDNREKASFLIDTFNFFSHHNSQGHDRLVQLVKESLLYDIGRLSSANLKEFLLLLMDTACQRPDLIEHLMKVISQPAKTLIIKKLPYLLFDATKTNDFKFFKLTLDLVKDGSVPKDQFSQIDENGDTMLTALCRNEKPNYQILEYILYFGFPHHLLLHKKDGKNALEWAEFTHNVVTQQVLNFDAERRHLFTTSLDEQNRRYQQSALLSEIAEKYQALYQAFDRFRQNIKATQNGIADFDPANDLPLETAREVLSSLQTKLKTEVIQPTKLEEISTLTSQFVKIVQLVAGFLTFKCANICDNEKVELTNREAEQLKKYQESMNKLTEEMRQL
ncbi:uncharacterized protein LOC142356087 [Convolutriloba macropyga]|uniref:uncharacterized protein LOC142356087 n=1 Tax=Convolutriloba macropyga TaxID=536237 RepID=UPI003F52066D